MPGCAQRVLAVKVSPFAERRLAPAASRCSVVAAAGLVVDFGVGLLDARDGGAGLGR